MTSILFSLSMLWIPEKADKPSPQPFPAWRQTGSSFPLGGRFFDQIPDNLAVAGEPVRHRHPLPVLDLVDAHPSSPLMVLLTDLHRGDQAIQGELLDRLKPFFYMLSRDGLAKFLQGQAHSLDEKSSVEHAPVIVHRGLQEGLGGVLPRLSVQPDDVLDDWKVLAHPGKLHPQVPLGGVPACGIDVDLSSSPYQAQNFIHRIAHLTEFLNRHRR